MYTVQNVCSAGTMYSTWIRTLYKCSVTARIACFTLQNKLQRLGSLYSPYSSAGGSTHRPWSLISWIRASVAPSMAMPRCTTVCGKKDALCQREGKKPAASRLMNAGGEQHFWRYGRFRTAFTGGRFWDPPTATARQHSKNFQEQEWLPCQHTDQSFQERLPHIQNRHRPSLLARWQCNPWWRSARQICTPLISIFLL